MGADWAQWRREVLSSGLKSSDNFSHGGKWLKAGGLRVDKYRA
jgi:hypothetical protein